MKIANFKQSLDSKKEYLLATFDIEEVEMAWNGKIDCTGIYRNWEMKLTKKGSYFVTSKCAYVDKSDPMKMKFFNHVELPESFKKEFNAQVMELLKPYSEQIKQSQVSNTGDFRGGYQDF